MEENRDETQEPQTTKLVGFKRLFIHMAIIAVLVVVGAVAAHFGLVLFTRHSARCVVPEFKGLIVNEAEYVASSNDLQIIINDSLYAPMYEGGMVLEQLPKAGVEVKPGRKVYVTINAFGSKMVTVPYVAGRSLRQAKNMLEVAGLQIEKLVYKNDMATNYVLAEYVGDVQIKEGSQKDVVVGSGVTLYVGMSQDERTTKMPLLVGMTLAEAKSRLWELGLNVGKINMPEGANIETLKSARVHKQGVYSGADVNLGTYVSFELTLDTEQVQQAAIEMEKEKAAKRAETQKAQEESSQQQMVTPAESVESTTATPTQSSVESAPTGVAADSFFE
ncbi:MAG: PASTA domain-containing protein [Rikenellaceae bacterium]